MPRRTTLMPDRRAPRRAPVVRRRRSAEGRVVRRAEGRRRLHHRPLGLGQVDAASLHQRARADQQRQHPRRQFRRQSTARPTRRRSRCARKCRWCSSNTTCSRTRPRCENVMMAPVHVLKEDPDEVRERARRAADEGRAGRQARRLSGRAVRRPAAARRDRALAGDAARGDAVRRGDRGARSGDRQGSAEHDPRAGARRHDLHPRHARDALRARTRRRRVFHRRRRRSSSRGRRPSCSTIRAKERTRAFLSQML